MSQKEDSEIACNNQDAYEQEEQLNEVLQRAVQGDSDAYHDLALGYSKEDWGRLFGLERNDEAFHWYMQEAMNMGNHMPAFHVLSEKLESVEKQEDYITEMQKLADTGNTYAIEAVEAVKSQSSEQWHEGRYD